ncbi:FxsA family protein [Halomonas sp. WWR20]
MPLLFLITLFALLDFVVLFAIGGQIGLLATLLLVLLTGGIGLHLIRREGVSTLQRAQLRFARGEIPSDELITGAALIFGGALLMAPGFLSDTLGLLCLIPRSRQLLGRGLARATAKLGIFQQQSFRYTQDDWANGARTSQTQSHRDPQDDADKTPLEGDFISKDEPRH